MKIKKLLCNISLVLCLTLIFSVSVFAEEKVTGDIETNQIKYVDDIDEYLRMLNEGLIIPTNTTITTYESEITPYGAVSQPSKGCSNIFGHKWSSWGSWTQINLIHRASGPCTSVIKRYRFCERTYCGASQTETDSVFVTSCHGDGRK